LSEGALADVFFLHVIGELIGSTTRLKYSLVQIKKYWALRKVSGIEAFISYELE